MDDPYGQARDVIIFAIPLVAPLSKGHPKILLEFNAYLYGPN